MPSDDRARLEAAYRAHGITHRAALDSYLRGCDFSQPVMELTLPPGSLFIIYVKDGTKAGKHAAPTDARPETLGIMMEGRHREVYRVLASLAVVQSTVADFEVGLIPNIGGAGGGIQYVLPPGWQALVERVS